MNEHPLRWGFFVTFGAILAVGLASIVVGLSSVIFSVFAAVFVTLGLDPLVRWFERRGLPRGWAIVTVIVLFIAVVVAILWILLPLIAEQVALFVRDFPTMIAGLRKQPWYQAAQSGSNGMLGAAYDWLAKTIGDPNLWATVGGGALKVGAAVLNGVSAGFFVFILTIYFTATIDGSKQAIYSLVAASRRDTVVDFAERIMQNVGRYLSGMVTLAFANAVFSLLLMLITGVRFALVIAVVCFVITLIPLIGTVLTTAFMTVVALFTSPVTALIVLIAMLVYMQIEAYVFTPRVMSKAVQVPGSIVLISALAGGTIGGLPGALVAIPVAAGILLIVKEVAVPHQAVS